MSGTAIERPRTEPAGQTSGTVMNKGRQSGDDIRFLRSWFDKPLITGAVAPSGPALGRTMAKIADPDVPGAVVELGPGTGPVTEALIARGFAPERLILIEYNPAFVDLLRERFPGVTVLRGDAYAIKAELEGKLEGPLAAVVSSLPLLARPVDERISLVSQAFDLLRPGAPFVQFTYGIGSPVAAGRIPGMTMTASRRIWLNIPPARVWAYRRP